MIADIVIFNPSKIADKATYLQPHRFPLGIEYVIVNGKIAIAKGKYLRRLNGRVLKHGRLLLTDGQGDSQTRPCVGSNSQAPDKSNDTTKQ